MPGISYLGTLKEETGAGFLAKAIGRGMGGLSKGYAEGKEREEELGIKYDLLEHSKKVDAARLVSSVLGHVSIEKRKEMMDDPEIIAVFAAAGVPIPTTPVPETGPSWMETWLEGEQVEVGKFNPARTLPGFAFTGKERAQKLPEGVSEEDIEYTMSTHKLTRQEVLKQMGE